MGYYKITAYEQAWVQYDYLVEADSQEEAIELLEDVDIIDSRATGDVAPIDGETIIDTDEDRLIIEKVNYSEFSDERVEP